MARVETALEKVVTSLNTRLNNLEVPTAPLVVQLFSFPLKHIFLDLGMVFWNIHVVFVCLRAAV